MKFLRYIITAIIASLASVLALHAQDVTVTVTTVQQILPPQVMLYVTNPSDYFNITLSNTGMADENVYLVMQVEQINPVSELAVSTPAERQPKLPIIVPAGGTRQLSPAEIKGLFNHIPLREVSAPTNLFDNYMNGTFALLPEGDYMAHMTAYRWDPSLETPIVVSSPSGGVAYFKVCYLAQPPRFLTPMAGNGLDLETMEAAEVDPAIPQFTWQAPTINCNPTAPSPFTYDFRVVELMPGQMPDEVMDGQNVVYQVQNLTSPIATIPQTIVKTMNKNNLYAAQVTAYSANRDSRMLNYISIVNGGKSTFRLFHFKKDQKDENAEEGEENEGEGKGDGDDDDEDQGDKDTEEDEDDWLVLMGNVLHKDSLNNDSLYTFRVPKITEPYFFQMDGARKKYMEASIPVEWEASRFMGGEGLQSDTIKFAYKVQLFNNGERADKMDAVQNGELVYESAEMTNLKDEILWERIQEQVTAGDYLVLRILPVVKHGHSVAFTGDENIIDFGLSRHATKQYFQCSDMVEIENKTATTKSAADFKGKEVGIGEYQLTIDEISGSASEGFKGKGRVAWEPFGSKIMVCVKFDKLRINSDDIVYEGDCVTYAAPEMKNAEFLDELFSDTGLDNIIADTELPYSDKLQGEADEKLKSLAERYNIADYYDEVVSGKNLYSLITTGGMDKLFFPVKLPSSIQNQSPVDIQIASMKFSPSNAQMNVVGEAKLPKSDCLNNEILLFGAPRLCISPTRFLPESGHLALLGNFTVNDRSSGFAITFKAPEDVQTPKNGCYVSWHDDSFEDLGLDVDMVIPDLRKDENGKATEECPILHASMRIGGWNDFIIDDVTMDPFQHLDIPGYTFTAKNIVVDLSDHRNSSSMGRFPDKYSRDEAGCKEQEELWHGLYIGDISVQFPSSLSIGENGERLKIHGEHMFFDKSGCTLTFGGDSILPPQTTGKMGGWGISLDHANLTIIQDHFENCHFDGRLDIPLFDKVDEKNDEFGEVAYDCTIRRLTDPRKNAKGERLEKMRYSYIFNTHQIDDLNFNFVVADVALDKRQTYFLLEAEDNALTDSIDTRVELCLGGNITIGGTDEVNKKLGKVNEKLKAITEELPLELKMPGIHFTKMRISNVARDAWVSNDATVLAMHKAREEAEKEVKAIAVLAAAKEHNIGSGKCFLNMGEWSLASAQKKIGPFNFKINEYNFDFDETSNDINFYINGGLELCEIVDVNAGITIMSKLQKPEKLYDIGSYSLSDGKVKFNDIELGVEVADAFTFEGTLVIVDEENTKGYSGKITIDVKELFTLNCDGGYFEHTGLNADEEKEKKAAAEQKAADEKKVNPSSTLTWQDFYDDDPSYPWGYFKVNMESNAGLRFDPIVVNRIAGGFYFNCRPTAGTDKEKDKFGGTPEEHFGNIGVALGIGMSTSAGEETLRADVDFLVAYDRQAKCLSTFLFNGKLKAVGGIIKADVSLVYENQRKKTSQEGRTVYRPVNRYLCLNLTAEAGLDTSDLKDQITGLNDKLASIKEKLDDFQANLDKVNLAKYTHPQQGLKQLSGDYEKNADGVADEDDTEDEEVRAMGDEAKNDPDFVAGKAKLTLEFKITWAKDGTTYPTPKWHLYLGEPAKDKRCQFTYLKFKSTIITVDIGADGYLCIGNELPDNGALPAIPTKITEFLQGHSQEGTNMGADMAKVERSRAKAARALLDPTSLKGGVMVGASCWGDINLNLGLIYGAIESLAGFDASLIHYGNNAVCMNSFSTMGKEGWYAMGQLYAYLAARLGVHIKIGHLIDEKVDLINAGIGGVLELGLPNPSWVEGQLRVKMSFLGGLFKLNKKFSFAAGDHCVPFVGNALDGFELFQEVSLGSDSLYEAFYKPEFSISMADVNKMTFTTNTSLGSHYRLVDPSYSKEMAKDLDVDEEKLKLHASRTYVFDMNQNLNENNMKMGVRLFDLSDLQLQLQMAGDDGNMTPDEFYKAIGAKDIDYNKVHIKTEGVYNTFLEYVVSSMKKRTNTVCETTTEMWGEELTNEKKALVHQSDANSIDAILENNRMVCDDGIGRNALKNPYKNEKNVSFREEKGTTFHLTNMNVEPGHCYMLVLSGDAYEINNGRRVWAQYVDTVTHKPMHIQWRQSKVWFFRVKSNSEDGVNSDNIKDLTPYVALAYPSVDGTKVKSGSEGYTTAYIKDIIHPTIALNRKVFNTDDKAKMKWVLTAYKASEYSDEDPNVWHETQTRDAKFIDSDNCFNIEPATPFNRISKFTAEASKSGYDFSDELYHLQLQYTFKQKKDLDYSVYGKYWELADTTRSLVDLWLTAAPHDITISGMSGKQDDSWEYSTSKEVTGEILPYSLPFVGARPDAAPKIGYESQYFNSNGKEILTDKDIVFINKKYNGTPYRLLDPYLYLAYLSKWTFIGDRAIAKYSFDDAYIPFASESLIFERNGTVVNSDFIKGENSKSLLQLRNDMYSTWNDWYYNNPNNQVEWPLPTLAKTAGGLTIVNQDGKASTITPINLNHFKDNTSNFIDLIEDFAAAYEAADAMAKRLRFESRNLFQYFNWCWKNNGNDFRSATFNDESFDNYMKTFNKMHRGQYLEVKHRDVTIKVPYYQLPLIFGGCFSSKGWPTSHYLGHELSASNRGFAASIGAKEMVNNIMGGEARWAPYVSNLLFFRLMGSEPIPYLDSTLPLTPLVFSRPQSEYADSYPYAAGTENQMQIEYDALDVEKSLRQITGFQASVYRVDSYDMVTGEYKMLKRGGGPWQDQIQIGTNGKYSTLADAYNAGSSIRSTLENNYDQPVPQALMSATKEGLILTLIYSKEKHKVHEYYDGRYITAISIGDDFMDDQYRYNGHYTSAEKVIIDKSFTDARVKSTSRWFQGFNKLKTIEGLKYLNTSEVTDMSYMFAGNFEIESLDLTSFDTQKVRDLENMFLSCSKLKTLKFDFKLPKAENMMSMFDGCSALTTIDLRNIECPKVENTFQMFFNCKSLAMLKINQFSPLNVKRYSNMFTSVPSGVTIYYAYDLDKRIRDQFPKGANLKVGSNPYKVVYAQTNEGEKVLMFLRNTTDFATGKAYDITANGITYNNAVIKNVWAADKVTNTGDSPGWYSSRSEIQKVIIDKGFRASPQTTKRWFYGFTNLTEIQGLNYLNTEDTKNMSMMFYNCSKIETLDVASFKTENVEDMSSMFYCCKAVKKLDVGTFNHKKVKSMYGMFYDCQSLTEISLFSNFSAGEMDNEFNLKPMLVNDMRSMFYNCKSLKQLRLTKMFDTRNVTNMQSMFANCSSLEYIDASEGYFETDNALYLNNMFDGCSNLKALNLSNFKTASAKNTSYMFRGCKSLQSLKLDNMTSESITGNSDMFASVPYNCTIVMQASTYEETNNMSAMLPKDKYVNLKLIYPVQMFLLADGENYRLAFISSKSDYRIGETWNGYKIDGIYKGMDLLEGSIWNNSASIRDKITSIVFDPSFANVRPTSTHSWFQFMSNLKKIEGLQYLNTSEVTSMHHMFDFCSNLTSLPSLNTLNTSKVKNMAYMFRGCSKLTNIDVSRFNTSAVTSMSSMFDQCSSLQSLNLDAWDVSNVLDMSNMFVYCRNLKTVKLSSWNTENVKDLGAMFGECSSLSELDLTGWRTGNVYNMSDMFYGCKNLKKLMFGKGLALGKLSHDKRNAFSGVTDMAVTLPFENHSALRDIFINNLGFLEGDTGWFVNDNDNNPEAPENIAQAIWTEDNKTLTFYYGVLRKEGDTLSGRKVTKVWSGNSVTESPNSGSSKPAWLNDVASSLTRVVFDVSFKEVKPNSTYKWFQECTNLLGISGLENLNTSEVTTMYLMFYKCRSLTSLDLSKFNTSKVEKMDWMFGYCNELQNIDVSSFNTSKVKSFNNMFNSCSKLTELDLSKFDSRKAEALPSGMFANDNQLRKLTVGKYFNFNAATGSVNAFGTTANATSANIDVYIPDTLATTIQFVKDAFVSKLKFVEGTTGRFITSKSKRSPQAIWTKDNKTLTFVYDYPYEAGFKFRGKTVTNVWPSYNPNNRNESQSTKWRDTVKGTLTTAVIDDSYSQVYYHNTASWFKDCSSLTTVTGLKNLRSLSTASMFQNTGIKSINLTGMDTQSVTNMNSMFADCTSLEEVICHINTENVTYMNSMFQNCSSLKKVDLTTFKTWKVKYMSYLFSGCKNLTVLYIGEAFSTDAVTSKTGCFTNVDPSNLIILWRGKYFYKSASDFVTDTWWDNRSQQLKNIGLNGMMQTTDNRQDTNIL